MPDPRVSRWVSRQPHPPTQVVLERVAKNWGVSVEEIMSRSRTATVSEARKAVYYLLSRRLSSEQIARVMGRESSSVRYGIIAMRRRFADKSLMCRVLNCGKYSARSQPGL